MIEEFKYSDLLRYGFSGGAFLIAFALSRFGADATISYKFDWSSLPALTVVALIIGSFIHCIHRVPHRFLAWCFRSFLYRSETPKPKPFEIDYRRWIRRAKYPSLQQNMDDWSSQILFLYGCFWAILLGALTGRYLPHLTHAIEVRYAFCPLVIIAVVSLLCALCQDGFAHYYERELWTKREDIAKELSSKPNAESSH